MLRSMTLAVAAVLLIAGCDQPPEAPETAQEQPSRGGGHAPSNDAFACTGNQFVDARIALDQTGDALAIVDTTGAALDTITVSRNQRVRWRILDDAHSDFPFYLVFDGNRAPSRGNHERGATMAGSASNGGVQELCMKIHPQAAADRYRYSVFVKYCYLDPDTCSPRVLDPIIYVRR